jgi:uroporphyrinogen decarboxylase
MLKGIGPHFPEPLKGIEDIKRLNRQADIDKELNYVFEAIRLTRHALQGRCPLFGFSGAPWTLMAYCIEGGASKVNFLHHNGRGVIPSWEAVDFRSRFWILFLC